MLDTDPSIPPRKARVSPESYNGGEANGGGSGSGKQWRRDQELGPNASLPRSQSSGRQQPGELSEFVEEEDGGGTGGSGMAMGTVLYSILETSTASLDQAGCHRHEYRDAAWRSQHCTQAGRSEWSSRPALNRGCQCVTASPAFSRAARTTALAAAPPVTTRHPETARAAAPPEDVQEKIGS